MSLWVLDKSAHVRLAAGASLPPDIDAAQIAVCEMGELEWLYSARSLADYEAQRAGLRATFPVLEAPPDVFGLVRDLQRDLASHHAMWHRTPIPDLFIAASALHAGAGVLHVDRHYPWIARVRPGLIERSL